MKKLFKRIIMLALCLVMVVSITIVSAEETGVTPRFVGIDSVYAGLVINENGRASCGCSVLVDTGYSVNVTMTLEQDGVAIKSWTGSGSISVDMSKTYYVASGHDYQVIVTTRVSTSQGSYLCSYTTESPVRSY